MLRKLKAGRNPKDGGWLSEPIWQAACRPWTWSRLQRKLDCDVVHELECAVLGVDQPTEWHDSHESQGALATCAIMFDFFGR